MNTNEYIRSKWPELAETYPSGYKPCPFCGSQRIQRLPQKIARSKTINAYLVKCDICPGQMLIITKYKSQAKCSWNHRVN